MLRKIISGVFLSLIAYNTYAQQFIGMTTNNYSAVHQLPLNPAWVNNALTGPEVNLFAVNVLAGNNAYMANMSILSHISGNTSPVEGKDYGPLTDPKNKKLWLNADIIGPGASFTYKGQYQLGIYTRFRTIANGGNVSKANFDIISDENHPQFYNHQLNYQNVGAVAHAFGEVGFSVGKLVRNDEYIKVGIGANIKYLIGYAAINAFSNSLTYHRRSDSLLYATGDATLLYTYNVTPGSNDLATRAGRGSLGLDIGMFYEYYGNDDPNITVPYKFSIAASITDIGSVSYVGDAGSGNYTINGNPTEINNVELQDVDNDEFAYYLSRLQGIGYITSKEKADKFRIGLPTALRINTDWNLGSKVYVSVNTLLNLRGNNGEVYNPGYASYLNITPRIDLKAFKIGLPITLMKYKTLNMGAVAYLGPLFVGSSSLLSLVTGQNISNIDAYAGLSWKFIKSDKVRLRSNDNGYDDPDSGIRRFIPKFLRGHGNGDKSGTKGTICPPQKFKNNQYKSYYK